MGQVQQLDQRMNEAGYLRLMVSDPLAMNMSNTLRGAPGGLASAPGRCLPARVFRPAVAARKKGAPVRV